jgi:hypothetical protein
MCGGRGKPAENARTSDTMRLWLHTAERRQGGVGRWGTPADKVRPCGALRLWPHGAGGGMAGLSRAAAR